MLGVVKAQLILSQIDYELECAGRKDERGLLFYIVAFVYPEIFYKLRKRRLRLVKVEYRVDIQRKLLRFGTG